MKTKNLGSEVLTVVNKQVKYEKTRASISFDAADIAGLSPGEISGFLQSLIRICGSLGKQELVISNIAPQVQLGKGDLGVVPNIHDEIVAHFANASLFKDEIYQSIDWSYVAANLIYDSMWGTNARQSKVCHTADELASDN